MNCEVCFEKFNGIEDLIKHEATGSHQDTVSKQRNTSLDHPANVVHHVAFANEASSSSNSVPVLDELVHIVSEGTSVAAGNDPNVSNLDTSIVNLFSCKACSMGFSNLCNIIQHSESMLHMIMVLATGIGFDEQADTEGDNTDLLPALYYCIVCNFCCFNSKLYDVHLKTELHGKIVQRLGNLLKESATDVCCTKSTSNYSSGLPLQHYCKLCNVKFENTKSLTRHLNKKKHQRILPLLKKIVYEKKENFDACFSNEQREDMNPSQYYCVLCNISVDFNECENHLKWKNHKRIERYVNTMYIYCGISDNDIDTLYNSHDIKKLHKEFKRLYHCKACSLWCFGSKSFASHLNGKKHCRKTKGKQIDTDSSPKSPDSSYSIRHCDTCNIQFSNSKGFKSHLKSKIHLRVAQIINKLSLMKEDGFPGSSSDAHADDNVKSSQLSYYCKLCDVQCSGPKNYDSHLKGKIHKKIKKIVDTLSKNTD